jgi:hypothetical protein
VIVIKLVDLIALLEASNDRSQTFDTLIGKTVIDVPTARACDRIAPNGGTVESDGANGGRRYTGSIDAAVTLVPAGWSWDVRVLYRDHLPTPSVRAVVFNDRTGMVLSGEYCEAEAETAPVALCIAALRARAILR